MLPVVAFVEVKVRVELCCPAVIVPGLALNVAVGSGSGVTVTVAWAVALPPGPVAV
jgi:hypothetical protein